MEVKYDQHFLNNEKILNLIIENSKINNNDFILEIGGGSGVLTQKIFEKKPKKLLVYEIDKKYFLELKKNFSNKKFFEIRNKNILEEDFEDFKNYKMISNIPYSISEGLFLKILENKIFFGIILCGKKFFENFFNQNSINSFYINSFLEIKKILEVNGNEFLPVTKVKSTLFNFVKKEENKKNDFEKLVCEIFFRRKRKTKNCIIFSLVENFNFSKKKAKETYEKLQIDIINEDKKFELLENKISIKILLNLKKLFS